MEDDFPFFFYDGVHELVRPFLVEAHVLVLEIEVRDIVLAYAFLHFSNHVFRVSGPPKFSGEKLGRAEYAVKGAATTGDYTCGSGRAWLPARAPRTWRLV